jgi:hypothetical protein
MLAPLDTSDRDATAAAADLSRARQIARTVLCAVAQLPAESAEAWARAAQAEAEVLAGVDLAAAERALRSLPALRRLLQDAVAEARMADAAGRALVQAAGKVAHAAHGPTD